MARLSNICVKWNNHHNALISLLYSQLENQQMLDVTIAAEGKFINVHRFLLCASSSYFEELLAQYDKPTVLILQNVKFSHLKLLVEYMYKGEVSLKAVQLNSFLEAAKTLQIKGLIKEETNPDQHEELTVETPDSMRPNQDEESADDGDPTALLEMEENLEQQPGDPEVFESDKVDDRRTVEEEQTSDPEGEMETNVKENPDCNLISNSSVDEDLLKSDEEDENDEGDRSSTGLPNSIEKEANGEVNLTQNQPSYQPFKCGACSRDFQNKMLLKRHSQSGKCLSVSYFRCGLCGSSSSERWSVKRHLTRFHKDVESSKFNEYIVEVEPMAFTCSVCSYRGEDLASLHKHKKKKHGLKLQFRQ